MLLPLSPEEPTERNSQQTMKLLSHITLCSILPLTLAATASAQPVELIKRNVHRELAKPQTTRRQSDRGPLTAGGFAGPSIVRGDQREAGRELDAALAGPQLFERAARRSKLDATPAVPWAVPDRPTISDRPIDPVGPSLARDGSGGGRVKGQATPKLIREIRERTGAADTAQGAPKLFRERTGAADTAQVAPKAFRAGGGATNEAAVASRAFGKGAIGKATPSMKKYEVFPGQTFDNKDLFVGNARNSLGTMLVDPVIGHWGANSTVIANDDTNGWVTGLRSGDHVVLGHHCVMDVVGAGGLVEIAGMGSAVSVTNIGGSHAGNMLVLVPKGPIVAVLPGQTLTVTY